VTTWNGLRRSPIGVKRRAMVRTEEGFYRTFEHLIRLHRCEAWHMTVAQMSQPGRPDYDVYGDGWYAQVELKARNPVTGRMGKLSAEQLAWKIKAERAGVEWHCFTLPDDWTLLEEWLISKTGIEVRGWASRQTAASRVGLVAS
jgi:hypothetical protein